MISEFLFPLCALTFAMVACVGSINQLCQFHSIFQSMSAKIESERWLVSQCEDPHFFSNMHLHSDICFTVENNARIGAFMLSLREFTRALLPMEALSRLGGDFGGVISRVLLSWPALLCFFLFFLFGPSWLVSGSRALHRRWPECRDAHFKDA
jgi:hypothetical protein